MSALVPYNYHGLNSDTFFGSHKRKKNYYLNKQFMGQSLSIPRPFPPNQSYYQQYFYPNSGRLPINYNQFGQLNAARDLINLNQLNDQYRYAQYARHLDGMQKNYWKRGDNHMPPTPHARTFWYETSGAIYQYEKETRYIPYPVFVGPGGTNLGFGRNLETNFPLLPRGPTGGLTTLIAPGGGTGNLPPKIRVIFMPTGFSSFQQPCTGALGMPPFLFNRMAQPFCSLPLPPPLPQIGSLPLTPAVQQMVSLQYANPVAILPYTPNLSMPYPMMSGYSQPSQFVQAPQQQQPLIAPTSALELPQYIPQSYIPPTLLPSNMPLLPSNAVSFPPMASNAIPSAAPYTNSGYPSTCRACIPAPPSLNVPVTGHCWVQHCSACHHVPADTSNPNNRSIDGRFTPLLRHPTVHQTACNPIIQQQQQQQQQYPHINTSVATRPWLHELPPLPPGAVVISEEYIDRNNVANTCYFTQNFIPENPRVFNSASRVLTFPSATNNINHNQTEKNRSGKKQRKMHKEKRSQSQIKTTSIISSASSSLPTIRRSSSSSGSSCSLCKAARANKQQRQSDVTSLDNQQDDIVAQSSVTARNVNLRYTYQPQDLHSVYNNNRHLEISDTDSLTISNPIVLPKYLQVKVKNYNALLSPIPFDSLKNEEQKSNRTSSPTPTPISTQSEKSIKKIIIIRQFRTDSPSSISTVSSNRSFRVIDNDFDSISTTDTIKNDSTTNENNEIL